MEFSRFKILIIIFLLVSKSIFGQHYDFVKIIQGQGIVYNNDSILLNKTTVKELHKKLNIKDISDPNISTILMWDGFKIDSIETTSGWQYLFESTSGSEYIKDIKNKSINFRFSDETDENNLKLKWIKIQEDRTLKIYTDNGFMIGMINPNFKEVFPNLGKNDYISKDGLTYNLYTYGISFQLEKLENDDLKIIEISVY